MDPTIDATPQFREDWLKPLRCLGLSNRVIHALEFYNIKSLGDLVAMQPSELKRFPNIGAVSRGEIERLLWRLGYEQGVIPTGPEAAVWERGQEQKRNEADFYDVMAHLSDMTVVLYKAFQRLSAERQAVARAYIDRADPTSRHRISFEVLAITLKHAST